MIYLLLLPCQEQLELQGHWKQRLKRPSQQRPRKEADEQSQTRNAFRKMSTTILLLNKMVYREVKELVCMKNLSINSWISVFLLPVEDLLGENLRRSMTLKRVLTAQGMNSILPPVESMVEATLSP